MNLIFDTNIILAIVRSKKTFELVEYLNPSKNIIFIPVSVEAEAKSIALQNNWGKQKIEKLEYFINLFTFLEVNKSLVNPYIEVDSFSQRKNPSFEIYKFNTPKNMAKNDLWIAATATFLGLELVTTDTDFAHLHNIFLEVRQIDQAELKKFF
jgi:tRNA(fMet)-specific endonuclease VapC